MKCDNISTTAMIIVYVALIHGCVSQPCEHADGFYDQAKLSRYCTDDLLNFLVRIMPCCKVEVPYEKRTDAQFSCDVML